MDINLIRIVVTVLSFIIFLVICWWAYAKPSQQKFSEAALLPLEDDFAPVRAGRESGSSDHV